MPVSDAIRELVERFEQNREAYRSSKYNETQLRREFLDPFFKALGWDMDNEQGYAEAYKDVIHEDSLEIEGETKAPDYAFRIGGTRKFFLEAKKPAVNIQYDIHPAFQLRRYAWSAKLPLSILSDFEEFAVYDCRGKPDKNDQVSTSRVMLLTYRDYVQKWDEIAAVFSRQAVLKGSFDSYAEGMKGKKGTTEVDDAFLAEIERWRDLLARNIAIRNPDLTVRELNYAVQMTIDRIIFLRICEDRGVERDGQLKEIATPPPPSLRDTSPISHFRNGGGREGVYSALCQLFQKADARYNSGLFHFKDEKEPFSSAADSLTLGLQIDDKILKDIIGNLYYPDSPYVFKVISSDILGQVYERFLGKVIRLTAGHQAKVEEKPEVRKAGGVYYTPTFIVDYIVINTLGKLLDPSPGPSPEPTPGPSPDGRTPSGEGGRREMTPREAARLKILDPACGSGTFLLSAYQYLLDWHLKWYMEHELEKWAVGKNPAIYQTTPPPSLRDTSPISACASLPWAVQGAALAWPPPSAAGTGEVRNGGGQGGGWKLTTARKKEILLNNIFGVDIDAQAVEVTKLSLLLKVLEGESNETIGSQLTLFQERVLPDLGRNIQCGNSLIGYDYFEGRMLVEQEERERVNAFDWQAAFPQVFDPYRPSATSPKSDWGSSDLGEVGRGFDVVIGNPPYVRPHNIPEYVKKYLWTAYITFVAKSDLFSCFMERGVSLLRAGGLFSFIVPQTWTSLESFTKVRKYLIDHANIKKLVQLPHKVFADATVETCIFVLEKTDAKDKSKNKIIVERIDTHQKNYFEREFLQKNIEDGYLYNFQLYGKAQSQTIIEKIQAIGKPLEGFVYFVYGFKTGDDEKFIHDEQKYPESTPFIRSAGIHRYWFDAPKEFVWYVPEQMIQNRKTARPGEKARFIAEKVIVSRMGKALVATYDAGGLYVKDAMLLLSKQTDMSLKYLLGLINSSLMNYYYREFFVTIDVLKNALLSLPIRPINFSNPAEKAKHDKMVSLVERMLALHKQSPRTPQEQEMVKREIESTDRAIDRLVYELYGLTEDEIGIVEGQ